MTKTNTQLLPKMIAIITITVMVFGGIGGVDAQQIDDLSRNIENKQVEIDGVNRKIEEYKNKISHYEQAGENLANEIAILENRSKKSQLDIEANELLISKTELELRRLNEEIERKELEIEQSKEYIGEVLQELYVQDSESAMEIIFGNEQFSDYFDQLQYLEILQEDLSTSVESISTLKSTLETERIREDDHKERLLDMRLALQDAKVRMEQESVAKDVLLAQTEHSEAQFRTLVQELRAEQQYIQSELFRLQESLKNKLDDNDQIAGGPTVLSWPVANPRITATFHDPTYPYRHLFEHSGLDMGMPTGTPITSAAPGYVAWARTGRSYGNYIMVIHANGVATLYAHLSSMNVSADQFVERGQIIGYSGNTGLSTGPHLHFESRVNGIPQNPYNYLVSH